MEPGWRGMEHGMMAHGMERDGARDDAGWCTGWRGMEREGAWDEEMEYGMTGWSMGWSGMEPGWSGSEHGMMMTG